MQQTNKIIAICESCDAQFYINKSEIKKNGRFVRCSLCDHEWLVSPIEEVVGLEPVISPVIQPPSDNSIYGRAKLLLFVLLCAISIYYLQHIVMPAKIDHTNAVYIQDIKHVIETGVALDHGRRNIIVTLYIENTMDSAQIIENIKLTGLDEQSLQLTQVTIKPHEVLEPHTIYPIAIKLPFYKKPPKSIRATINGQKEFTVFVLKQ